MGTRVRLGVHARQVEPVGAMRPHGQHVAVADFAEEPDITHRRRKAPLASHERGLRVFGNGKEIFPIEEGDELADRRTILALVLALGGDQGEFRPVAVLVFEKLQVGPGPPQLPLDDRELVGPCIGQERDVLQVPVVLFHPDPRGSRHGPLPSLDPRDVLVDSRLSSPRVGRELWIIIDHTFRQTSQGAAHPPPSPAC